MEKVVLRAAKKPEAVALQIVTCSFAALSTASRPSRFLAVTQSSALSPRCDGALVTRQGNGCWCAPHCPRGLDDFPQFNDVVGLVDVVVEACFGDTFPLHRCSPGLDCD